MNRKLQETIERIAAIWVGEGFNVNDFILYHFEIQQAIEEKRKEIHQKED